MQHRRIVLFFGLLALLSARPVAWAEEPPVDPEQVLREAGLKLVDNSYILESATEAEAIHFHILALKRSWRSSELRYWSLRRSYEQHAKDGYPQASSEWEVLNGIVNGMAADMAEMEQELSHHRQVVAWTSRRYDAVAEDPQIKAALRALNKGRHPKLALGPATAYRTNVASQSTEVLKTLGYRAEGDLYWLAEEDDFITQGRLVVRQWREIARYEPRLAPPATRGSPPTSAAAKKPLTAAEMATWRAEFVRCVGELRRQAEGLQKQREILLADGECSDAIDELNRARGKARHAKLGTNPGLSSVLQNLEAMERAILTAEAGPAGKPVPRIPATPAESPRLPQDISKLPRYMVLSNIPDGDTISVKKPEGGQLMVQLLGVASPFASNGGVRELLRRKFLVKLLKDQQVAMLFDRERPLQKGRSAARVYRVADGVEINLKMVEAGYSVTADDAPTALKSEFLAAERVALAEQRGLWSPEAHTEAAALAREKEQLQKDREKMLQEARNRNDEKARPKKERKAAMIEEFTKEEIQWWASHFRPNSPEYLRSQELARQAEERRRAQPSPEINAGPAAVALALLIAGVLMLGDRRRARPV